MKIEVRTIEGGDIVGSELPGMFDIRFGEGESRVTVKIRDGGVEIIAAAFLVIYPRGGNAIQVASVTG